MGKIMKRIIPFVILLCFGWSLRAQNVTVTGQVNRSEALVRLMVYDDLLNMHETLVAETTSDAKGNFVLSGEVAQTMPAGLYVGLEGVDFVVTPDAAYDVVITVPDADPSLSYFERPMPTLRVVTVTDQGIYRQLVVSREIIDGYVLNYFDGKYTKK